ncbi:MAG TPA: acyl-CoA reductase [Edaphocola sp.]|nr:acyl-CoA reductase [Edaphocola sp.]
MTLKERIALMTRLGAYFLENNNDWQTAKEQAYRQNPWFIPAYIDKAVNQIAQAFLTREALDNWAAPYPSFKSEDYGPEVGIVMAGNLPLVGFHDFLSVFISGCRQRIKLSSKDSVLWQHIFRELQEWRPETEQLIAVGEQLKNCAAYIATGSNNSSRYFQYYFAKFPHIIRKSRSSIAVLTGRETPEALSALCDDICLYFGLGCRNVTQVFVPENYDFGPLKKALKKYEHHLDYSRYKNNYDYQLALVLLNKIDYQAMEPVILVPSDSLFAPISVLHYQTYGSREQLSNALPPVEELQCIVAEPDSIPDNFPATTFGQSQFPVLDDYADGVNTLEFLSALKIS